MCKLSQKNSIIVLVVSVVVVGMLSFWAGSHFGVSKKFTGNPMMLGGAWQGQQGSGKDGNKSGRMNGGFVGGEVLKIDDKSMTVKLPDGGSKIIYWSGATTVSESVPSEVAKIVQGKNVMVTGTPNSDGSLTAKSIEIKDAVVPTPDSFNVPVNFPDDNLAPTQPAQVPVTQ